jgi:hypothetical protein
MSQMGTAVPASMERARRHMSSRQAATVQRLVEAALEELRERGYGDLTLRNVARRAGVAPATAYTHFASRSTSSRSCSGVACRPFPRRRLIGA